jgi:hypothetical protein
MSEQCCGTCKWANPSDLPGWKKCVVPIPEKSNLPYWMIHSDAEGPADVEVDDTDCDLWEKAQP